MSEEQLTFLKGVVGLVTAVLGALAYYYKFVKARREAIPATSEQSGEKSTLNTAKPITRIKLVGAMIVLEGEEAKEGNKWNIDIVLSIDCGKIAGTMQWELRDIPSNRKTKSKECLGKPIHDEVDGYINSEDGDNLDIRISSTMWKKDSTWERWEMNLKLTESSINGSYKDNKNIVGRVEGRPTLIRSV